MPAASVRRLPGFRFEAQNPPLDDALPRMDVALFVGFAASGPIDVPVAVAQIAEFTAVFGRDIPLAWDLARGEQVYSHLGPAVRSFFQNGGRRCWVVRVAGPAAASNCFPLAGLSRVGPSGALCQARAAARSEGSWSDGLRVATVVHRQSVPVAAIAFAGQALVLDVTSARGLTVGDLIRLTFRRDGHVAFGAVAAMAPTAGGATRLTLDSCHWFAVPDATPAVDGTATFVAAHGEPVRRPATTRAADLPPWRPDAPVTIDLDLEPTDDVPPGTFISVTFGGAELALVVAGTPASVGQTGSRRALRVQGSALWRRMTAPYAANAVPLPAYAERLLLELLVKSGDAEPVGLGRLGLAPTHPGFWATLPTDAAVYEPIADPTLTAHDGNARPVLAPHFPLAGDGAGVCIPIGDPLLPDFLAPFKHAQPAAVRDGLEAFEPAVFLEPRLRDSATNALYGRAEFVRYQSGRPDHRLRGVHAALFIDEISLIAVPDAVHRTWHLAEETLVGPGSPPHAPPEDSGTEPDSAPAGDFRVCHPCILAAPWLNGEVNGAGRITLTWSGEGTRFTVEESIGPEFAGWATVAQSARRQFVIYDRPPGEYAYRVTAGRADLTSAPSNVAQVTVRGRRRAVIDAAPYDSSGLLDVQRALLRLCAVRGDAVGVLGLPEHYRDDDALEHVRALTSPSARGIRAGGIAPLNAGEEAAFSYGALYHPWLIVTEGRTLRRVPPDGAAAGVLARRALSRGAWIAPANETLSGVVALTPALAPGRRLELQLDQINIVRQEPRGFVMLGADTLSRDEELRPLSVRRLLILLRRAALQLGASYVFEPNDDSFRRLVQRGFEEMLGQLHARGAFAGDTASSSFQVVTEASLNTAQARDQGRFFVELRVAPSAPLTFLTIRLVQSGDRLTVNEGR